MADKDDHEGLDSPRPSVINDDDDQDDDFVASDGDASDSDDADESDSGGSESGDSSSADGDSEAAGSPDLGPYRDAILQALQDEEAPMQDEAILSDSELSQVSSDVSDALRRALEMSEEEEEEQSGGDGDAGIFSDAAATPSGKARPPEVQRDAQSGGAAPVSPPFGTPASARTRSNSAAAAAAAAARAATATPILDAPAASGNSGDLLGSPPLEAFGATLGPLGPELPIAQRTRAHISLMDVSIEDLEGALAAVTADEEVLRLELDDGEEYERFLQSLREAPLVPGEVLDAHLLTEAEDSDDEDFGVELERLLEDATGREERPRRARQPRRNSARKAPAPKQPRRSRRLLGKNAERPKFAARLAAEQRMRALQPLFDQADACMAEDGQGGGADCPADPLAELACLATDPLMADAADVLLQAQQRVPLPSDPPQTAAINALSVTWQPPLPAVMRRYMVPVLPDNAPVVAAHFQPEQYATLYRLVHDHVQLLAQVHALAVGTGNRRAAVATAEMLIALEEFARQQGQGRQAAGIPPYVPDCLGMGPLGQQLGGSDGWVPSSDTLVYTVADVAPLRAALLTLQSMLHVPVPEEPPQPSPPQQQQQEEEPQRRVRKRRRRGKLPEVHVAWESLPEQVTDALHPMRVHFNPDMEPQAPTFVPHGLMLFLPAEDDLLAWGIRKHCYEWARIRAELLPTKTEAQLFHRKKNRCAGSAPDNQIKHVVWGITMPITPAEEVLLQKATAYYTKRQTQRWEIICKEHLPHRHPQVLSMLWSEHQKGGGRTTVSGMPRRLGPPLPAPLQPAFLAEAPAVAPVAVAAALAGDVGAAGSNARQHQGAAPQTSTARAAAAGAVAVAAELTVCSPPRLVASELQRLGLRGSGAAPSPASAAAAASPHPSSQGGQFGSTVAGNDHPSPAGARQVRPVRARSRGVQRAVPPLPVSGSAVGQGLSEREHAVLRGTLLAATRAEHEMEREDLSDSEDDGGQAEAARQRLQGGAAAEAGAEVALAAHGGSGPPARQHVWQQQYQQQQQQLWQQQYQQQQAATVGAIAAKGLRYEAEEMSDSDEEGVGGPGRQSQSAAQMPPAALPPQPAAWPADDDRLLLRTALRAGGTLSAEQLRELALVVGRDAGVVEARARVLMERFREKAEQRQAQLQQQAGERLGT